jgi:hypothetical protein
MAHYSWMSTPLQIATVLSTLLLLLPVDANAGPRNNPGSSREPAKSGDPRSQIAPAPFVDVRVRPGATMSLASTAPVASPETVPFIFILGTPKGVRISDGSHEVITQQEDETVDTTGWDLSKLAMELPTDVAGRFLISAMAATETSASAVQSLFNVALEIQSPPENANSRSVRRPALAADIGAVGSSLDTRATQDRSAIADGERKARSAVPLALASGVSGAPAEPNGLGLRIPDLGSMSDKGDALTTEGAMRPSAEGTVAQPLGTEHAAHRATSEPNSTTLVDRARRLIRVGDVSGARLILERAVARGYSQAAFYLAETYDPQVLRAWKVQGMQPDQQRARELYAIAEQDGRQPTKVVAEVSR